MTDAEWGDEFKLIVELLDEKRPDAPLRLDERELVEQAILRTMEQAGFSDTANYSELLKSDPAALDRLLVATTISDSYFFQDSGQFRIVSDLILPDIRRRRGPGHTMRFWSADCGFGEEVYSLAMLLHRSGALSQATILGTDKSPEALERARTAIYQESSLRGEGLKMAKPYLTARDGQYFVSATMKKSVRFESLNLSRGNYPSIGTGTRGVDLILCRNVLSHLDEQTAHIVVSRLYRSLAEGGWLITAPSDPPILEFEMFDFVPTEDGLAYRKANPSFTGEVVADPYALEDLSEVDAPSSIEVPSEPRSQEIDEPRELPSAARDEAPGVAPSVAPSVASSAVPSAAPIAERNAEPIAAPSFKSRVQSRVAKPLGNKRLAEARQALAECDYQRAADLTNDMRGEAAIIHIKAMSNIDVERAAKASEAATTKRPLSQELNYLKAVLMIDLNRHHEAAESLRRVLYLDESLARVHFSLGTALRKLGDFEGARHAFREALQICDGSPPNQPVPLGDDETVGELRARAKTELDAVDNLGPGGI